MDSQQISIKLIIYTSIFSMMIVLLVFFYSYLENRTKIVFCDVGQGDAAYIRVHNRVDILIDAGPGSQILSCLGKHMPFYDRTIELAILTHPQQDHYGGYNELIHRYKISTFLMNPLSSANTSYKELLRELHIRKVRMSYPTSGDTIRILDSTLTFYWPTNEFLKTAMTIPYQQASSNTDILGETTLDPNIFSIIFAFQQNNDRILFTGDTTPGVEDRLLEESNLKSDILKMPHHGSKNGLTEQFLQLADPMITVISAGRNNRYGHPSPEIIALLDSNKKKYIRTDQNGSVIFYLPLRKTY